MHTRASQFDAKYHQFPSERLPAVFIDQDEIFPTLEQFVTDTVDRYFLSLYESLRDGGKSADMSEAFRQFLKMNPETKGIVIGIRHTDPFAQNLLPIQRTDPDWPDFMRLQPLLHWKLANIWSFLLYSGEPTCGLYKLGFTSIGNINETNPNPYLKATEHTVDDCKFQWEIENAYNKSCSSISCSALHGDDIERAQKLDDDYFPGWFLTDDSLERAGRIKRKPPNN